ncbi:MAG UNVERIFIED_CONTAM: GNAT family N-acetyltransferase [Anaerolineae bacterium]
MYDLYRTTSERDGFLIRPLDYYRQAWQQFMERGLAQPLIAEHAGTPIAHVILYHFGKTCWYFYGASSNDERNRHAQLLATVGVHALGKSFTVTPPMTCGAHPISLMSRILCGGFMSSSVASREKFVAISGHGTMPPTCYVLELYPSRSQRPTHATPSPPMNPYSLLEEALNHVVTCGVLGGHGQ